MDAMELQAQRERMDVGSVSQGWTTPITMEEQGAVAGQAVHKQAAKAAKVPLSAWDGAQLAALILTFVTELARLQVRTVRMAPPASPDSPQDKGAQEGKGRISAVISQMRRVSSGL